MRYFVLDTSIVIHLLKNSPLYQQVEIDLGLTKSDCQPIVSVVTHGELTSFAKQRNWGGSKLSMLNAQLASVVTVDIGHKDTILLGSYTDIDAFSKGKSPDRRGFMKSGSSYKMGKNDLWIAATALTLNCPLVTADGDFDHLDGTMLKVHRYDPGKFPNK